MHKSQYKKLLHGKKKWKRKEKWAKVCRNASFHPWKLKRPMKLDFPP